MAKRTVSDNVAIANATMASAVVSDNVAQTTAASGVNLDGLIVADMLGMSIVNRAKSAM